MRDEPAKASGDEPAWSGFDGSPEDRIRQLELENDILRGVVEVLKAARPRALTNGEKTLVIEHLRRHRPQLERAHGFLEDIQELL